MPRPAKNNVKKKVAAYAEGNLAAARIIRADRAKYGGKPLMVQWARAVLAKRAECDEWRLTA
jgi:hypothetical protein